jgi:hypothetical protein
MADHTQALELLNQLLERGGTLKFITNTPSRNARSMHPADPAAWEHKDIIGIEGPDHKGRVLAYTADGDWCAGKPVDVLARLMQVKQMEHVKRQENPLAFAAALVKDRAAETDED